MDAMPTSPNIAAGRLAQFAWGWWWNWRVLRATRRPVLKSKQVPNEVRGQRLPLCDQFDVFPGNRLIDACRGARKVDFNAFSTRGPFAEPGAPATAATVPLLPALDHREHSAAVGDAKR